MIIKGGEGGLRIKGGRLGEELVYCILFFPRQRTYFFCLKENLFLDLCFSFTGVMCKQYSRARSRRRPLPQPIYF